MKVSLILLIALATCALLRRRPAALRHGILAGAVIAAALMPALERMLPPVQLAVTAPSALQPIAPPARSGSSAPGAAGADGAAGSTLTRAPDTARAVWRDLPSTLWWLWIAGAAVNLLVLLVGFARLRWLAARATPVTLDPWRDAAARVAREYGIARPVLLLSGRHPGLLVTWGLRRPRIMVPSSALEWDPARVRVVLRHELAHVQRHDWAVQLAAELLRCLYWFNPLTWIACRRLRAESEQAADDAVLLRGVEPSEYAAHLLDVARILTRHHRAWAAAPAMVRPSSLERRVRAMLNHHVDRQPLSRASRVAYGIAIVVISAAVASLGFAQGATARFSGSVADPTGAPLPETTVSLTHRVSSVTHAAPTDQAGVFSFDGLPPGEYILELRAIGFAPLKDTLTMAAGETVQRDIRMNIASVQETITVAAVEAPPASQPTKTAADVARLVDRLRGRRLQPPIKINHVRPVYPTALRDAGVEGQVVLGARIGTDGTVSGIEVVSPAHPDLVSAAIEAARQWRFEPTRLWGSPVEVGITMTFNFRRQS